MTATEVVAARDTSTGLADTFTDEKGSPVLRTVRDKHGMSVYVPVGDTESGWQLVCVVEPAMVRGEWPASNLIALSFSPILRPEGWAVERENLTAHAEAVQHGVV